MCAGGISAGAREPQAVGSQVTSNMLNMLLLLLYCCCQSDEGAALDNSNCESVQIAA